MEKIVIEVFEKVVVERTYEIKKEDLKNVLLQTMTNAEADKVIRGLEIRDGVYTQSILCENILDLIEAAQVSKEEVLERELGSAYFEAI